MGWQRKGINMYNVTDFGVVSDNGETLQTERIQALIDKCRAKGGGHLLFPAGVYLCGGLELCNNLTIELENGCTILGSPELEDYTLHNPSPVPFHEGQEGVRAIFFADEQHDIRLCGEGTVDGQGAKFNTCSTRRARPRNIWFSRCQNVTVENLSLRNAGFWMQHYIKCMGLTLKNLNIWNHMGTNNDGIDIDSCRDVIVCGCRIDSHDDAICLKSGCHAPSENVIVTDCQTRSHCNHLKLGTESNGGFRNIRFSNIILTASECKKTDGMTQGCDYRGAAGIALGAVDGACMENICAENITMDGVLVPFFIRLGYRARGVCGPGSQTMPPGFARNIIIRNIVARNASAQGCYIAGYMGNPIREVAIVNCRFEFEGSFDETALTRQVEEKVAGYPSWELFGKLMPAYGIFCRDVEDLQFNNVQFLVKNKEVRPAVLTNRCRKVKAWNLLED